MSLATPIIRLIDREPVSIDIGQKLSDAYRILSDGRIHHLPVVAERRLVGMLSTCDMLRLKSSVMPANECDLPEQLDRFYRLDEVMHKDLVCISDRATLGDAARRLCAGGFHSLPVVDRDGALVGVVTTTDLMDHILRAPPRLDLPSALKERLRALEQVRRAAEACVDTGQAGPQRRRLEQALESARTAASCSLW